MTKERECSTIKWAVVPKGEPLFSEMATMIEIDDEAAGEFVKVSQQTDDQTGSILIDVDEWPSIRAAINMAVRKCRECK